MSLIVFLVGFFMGNRPMLSSRTWRNPPCQASELDFNTSFMIDEFNDARQNTSASLVDSPSSRACLSHTLFCLKVKAIQPSVGMNPRSSKENSTLWVIRRVRILGDDFITAGSL